MSQESLPPEADELVEIRREALQLLREILHAARVSPAQRCAMLARVKPPAALVAMRLSPLRDTIAGACSTRHALRETRTMDSAPDHLVAIARLQEQLLRTLPALPRSRPPSPELVTPAVPPRSPELAAQDAPTVPSPRYHQGHFSARHHLTPEQAWLAEELLRQKPPFRGPHAQQKEAARIAGIVSSVRNGRVNNTRWGRTMLARRGGLAMAAHGLHLLREIAPRGGQAAAAARALKKATAHWEQTGQVLALEQAETDQIPLLQPLNAWPERPFMAW